MVLHQVFVDDLEADESQEEVVSGLVSATEEEGAAVGCSEEVCGLVAEEVQVIFVE